MLHLVIGREEHGGESGSESGGESGGESGIPTTGAEMWCVPAKKKIRQKPVAAIWPKPKCDRRRVMVI